MNHLLSLRGRHCRKAGSFSDGSLVPRGCGGLVSAVGGSCVGDVPLILNELEDPGELVLAVHILVVAELVGH